MDETIRVSRWPRAGETVRSVGGAVRCCGGKGVNQAVAVARLGGEAAFVGRVGSDESGEALAAALRAEGVDCSGVERSETCGSGRGLVVAEERSGEVWSIVTPGANAEAFGADAAAAVAGASAVLLQREVSSETNRRFARAAKEAGIPVFLDAGGDEGGIDEEVAKCVDWLTPNLTELASVGEEFDEEEEASIEAAARALSRRYDVDVVVTMGARGSLVVCRDGRSARRLAEPATAVDETAAGDAFRAAFAVGVVDRGLDLERSLDLASKAGAVAVSRPGAITSLPRRADLEEEDGCPWRFASRLNSMKARRDLAGDEPDSTLGWIRRQGRIEGLDLVDFNYPQHLASVSVDEVARELRAAGLGCGAVCLRYPAETFRLGAFSNPDAATRDRAVQLTIEAADWARALGADQVVVWSAFCGYDYSCQIDYVDAWTRMVDCFRRVCDARPDVRVSLEFKPTDEQTRFFVVPSTGAALLLSRDVDRPNFGLTLDFGHLLAAGENPAQSVAAVANDRKLFGIQLNDGYQRLGAEDGLLFASVHRLAALELVFWLRRFRYDGHVYFDTFPRNEDPVLEAHFNIRTVKTLYDLAATLDAAGLDAHLRTHDALAALALISRLDAARSSP